MSILTVHELKKDRDFKFTIPGGKNARSYTRVFRVRTSDPATSLVAIGTADLTGSGGGKIPLRFDEHPDDAGALCVDVSAKQEGDDGLGWIVTCSYSTDADTTSREDEEGNPLTRRPKYKWGFALFQSPLERDVKTGKVVTNSAGDAFDPPAEKDDALQTLTITRNESNYDAKRARRFINAINADPFLGEPPKTWRITNIDASEHSEQGLTFYEVAYELVFKEATWTKELLDIGFREFNTSGFYDPVTGKYELKAIRPPGSQERVDAPHLLNGAGVALAVGADGKFLKVNAYHERPFRELKLER